MNKKIGSALFGIGWRIAQFGIRLARMDRKIHWTEPYKRYDYKFGIKEGFVIDWVFGEEDTTDYWHFKDTLDKEELEVVN